MAEKIAEVVLTYPPEVWQRTNPEVEAMVLGTKGFYCVTNLKEGIINAIPFSETDARAVFDEAVVSALNKMGVRVEFKLKEVRYY